MIRVTDNKEIKETVLAGLKHNKDKYGKRYCPCSLVRNDDTVCILVIGTHMTLAHLYLVPVNNCM